MRRINDGSRSRKRASLPQAAIRSARLSQAAAFAWRGRLAQGMHRPAHMKRDDPCRCEVIWDEGLRGVAETPSGEVLLVEDEGPWTPSRVFSAAAQASLMFEFFRLAEASGLEVLGYLSNAYISEGEASDHITLQPCILLASQLDVARAEGLLDVALTKSRVCRQLSGALDLDGRFVAARQASA